mmetsp:Transcript_19876/g.64678  ORF Transcript_19876/g.64678 Transcript_19876/m.64678 type:complete len:222 (-) Transcript_19876:74-739(-)
MGGGGNAHELTGEAFYNRRKALMALKATNAAKRRLVSKELKMAEEFNIRRQVTRTFAAFDNDNSGLLSRAELGRMIEDMTGELPAESELNYVLSRTDMDSDGTLTKEEFQQCIEEWFDYAKQKHFITVMFELHDKDKSGSLSMRQIKSLLTDLNEGVKPKPEEVRRVLNVADENGDELLDKGETIGAIVAWYNLDRTPEALCSPARCTPQRFKAKTCCAMQ